MTSPTVPCSVESLLRHKLNDDDHVEAQFERLFSIFADAPYDYCEFNVVDFNVYDLLALALAYMAADLEVEFEPGEYSQRKFRDAITATIWKIEP